MVSPRAARIRRGSIVLPSASIFVVGTGWDLFDVEKERTPLPMLASKTVDVISFIAQRISERAMDEATMIADDA